MRKLTSCRGVRAFVTGASSGIGRALALRLGREGARLALVARRVRELDSLAAEIRRAGGEALVLPCDLAERTQVDRACAQALAQLGAVDLLVNDAGYGRHRPFVEWELEDMERMTRVNYLAPLQITHRLLPAMLAQRRGFLVFVGSVAGRLATPFETAYAASKFALAGLAEALSLEVEDEGVHVLTVFPGVVRTAFFDEAAWRALPAVARRQAVEADALAKAILRALRHGRRELTVPRALAAAYLVRSLAPSFFRRQVKRVTRPTTGG